MDTSTLSISRVFASVGVVLLTSVAYVITRALRRKLRIARGLAPIPGPKGVFLLGNMPRFIKHKDRIYHFLEDLLKQYGGRMKMPWHLFFDGAIYITDPADVKHILATNFNNYVKPQGFIDGFKEIFEHSFFAMNHAHTPDNGEKWKLQRKVAAKVFTTKNFKLFTEQVLHRYALQMTEIIRSQENECDMQELSAKYTLQSIFDIAFGIDLQTIVDPDHFAALMNYVNEHCAKRLFVKQYYKLFWWCMPSEYKVKQYTNEIRAIADKILLTRLAEAPEVLENRFDILSLFIKKARELDEDQASLLCPKTLRSIILTFIFAGRDTTAECITYTFYSLARNPAVQEKIDAEMKALEKTNFTYEDIKNMRYLDAVVHEAIRLYPSLPYNVKMAVEDDHLPDGTFVPAGCDVVYSPWFMGRNNKIWGNDALDFRPERWLEMETKPTAFEFPAFQAGPRICIGMNLAILEAKMFTAVMLQHFRVKIKDGEPEERGYVLKSGLFMEGGLPLAMIPVADRS